MTDDSTVSTDRPLHEDPGVHARRWTLLGVMCLSLTVVVMSVSGLNVALVSAVGGGRVRELFGDLRFRTGSAVITTAFFAMFGFFFLNTLYLQFVRGYSPLLAGASTLPLAVAMVIVAPRSSDAADRFGTGRIIGLGFVWCRQVSSSSPKSVRPHHSSSWLRRSSCSERE